MRYPALRRAALAACLVPSLYGAAAASTAVSDDVEKIAGLGAFVARTLAANPKVLAASAAVDAEAARNRGAARPLFNPALELEYENADIDLATVEYRQTLDWHDKRGAKKEAADAALEAARATYHAVREQVAGELLGALVDLDRASLTQDLAAERVKLLERFVALHERRASAGDIGQTELQLAHIALAEARLLLADAAAETIVAGTNMSRLAGAAPEQTPAFPASVPAASAGPDDLESLATRHPVVHDHASPPR